MIVAASKVLLMPLIIVLRIFISRLNFFDDLGIRCRGFIYSHLNHRAILNDGALSLIIK